MINQSENTQFESLKTVFEIYRNKYSKVFSILYPAKNSTGFPERNLSVNFSKSVEELYPSACTWFEFQFGDKNNLHYDAIIVVPETKTIYLVESKRFSSIKSKKDEIKKDMMRINESSSKNKNDFICRIPDFEDYTVFGVVLADVWTETKGKRAIKESFVNKSFINTYISDMGKSFRGGEYFVEGFGNQSNEDDWKNKYYLLSMVWKV